MEGIQKTLGRLFCDPKKGGTTRDKVNANYRLKLTFIPNYQHLYPKNFCQKENNRFIVKSPFLPVSVLTFCVFVTIWGRNTMLDNKKGMRTMWAKIREYLHSE